MYWGRCWWAGKCKTSGLWKFSTDFFASSEVRSKKNKKLRVRFVRRCGEREE